MHEKNRIEILEKFLLIKKLALKCDKCEKVFLIEDLNCENICEDCYAQKTHREKTINFVNEKLFGAQDDAGGNISIRDVFRNAFE